MNVLVLKTKNCYKKQIFMKKNEKKKIYIVRRQIKISIQMTFQNAESREH